MAPIPALAPTPLRSGITAANAGDSMTIVWMGIGVVAIAEAWWRDGIVTDAAPGTRMKRKAGAIDGEEIQDSQLRNPHRGDPSEGGLGRAR